MSIIAENVFKIIGETKTKILQNINLEIKSGEFVSLIGRSGSGKSSLLYILSSLDKSSSGNIYIGKHNLSNISDDELHILRNLDIGFIFQFHYLLQELTVLENVLFPATRFKLQKEKEAYAIELLEKFNLIQKIRRFPRQLSGGEQQRVAIARALLMQPKYIFADEPTGSLDSSNGEIVMNILQEINKTFGTTIILVTHDIDFANTAQRKIRLLDGQIVNDETA